MADPVKVKTSLFGGHVVAYRCPKCSSKLTSPLDDAGNIDNCPECGQQFNVPGADERKWMLAEQAASAEARRRAAASKEEANCSSQPVAHSEATHIETSGSEVTGSASQTHCCPYCAETILIAAKKCKHCGEFLQPVPHATDDTMQKHAIAFGFKFACGVFLAVAVVLAAVVLIKTTQDTNDSSERGVTTQRSSNMKMFLIALQNYHDANKHFPPAAIYGADGKPLLSWRVAILPYCEEGDLYKRFHLNEPWDSPHNRELIKEMPATFDMEFSELAESGKTTLVVPVGRDTVFYGNKGAAIGKGIPDGSSNTIVLVEVNPSHAVIWTKPEDWDVDAVGAEAVVQRNDRPSFLAGFADAHVEDVPVTIDRKLLRSFLTRAGNDN